MLLQVTVVTGGRFEIRRGEPGYPACLDSSPRPPRVVYGVGDPSVLTEGLGVIGSRKATPYGLSCARLFAGHAAAQGVIVVSGAAIGCDMAAQMAALEAGGRTVAVLGCGADVDYPHRARALLTAVRAGGGAVVSELAWGTPPLRGHFPARNRIIAALSSAVLVVEAAMPSGTFNTADHALAAGRTVLSVPGSVFFSGSAGCNRLLRQGAGLVASTEDLDDELAAVGLTCPPDAPRSDEAHPAGCDDACDVLLAAVRADPCGPDALASGLGIAPVELMRRLSRLEADGRIARYPDGRYGPC